MAPERPLQKLFEPIPFPNLLEKKSGLSLLVMIRLVAVVYLKKTSKHDLRCVIASCELQCAVASCDVRVQTHFFETCDVRACGEFLSLRRVIAALHVF